MVAWSKIPDSICWQKNIYIIGEIVSKLTSFTWKYVPLSGKLPLVAVRHGICLCIILYYVILHNCLTYLLQVGTLKECRSVCGPWVLLTKSVPRTICEAACEWLLSEKDGSTILLNSLDSWGSHRFSSDNHIST